MRTDGLQSEIIEQKTCARSWQDASLHISLCHIVPRRHTPYEHSFGALLCLCDHRVCRVRDFRIAGATAPGMPDGSRIDSCELQNSSRIRPQNRPAFTAGVLDVAGGHRQGAADAMPTVAQSSLIQVNFLRGTFQCSASVQPADTACADGAQHQSTGSGNGDQRAREVDACRAVGVVMNKVEPA